MYGFKYNGFKLKLNNHSLNLTGKSQFEDVQMIIEKKCLFDSSSEKKAIRVLYTLKT